MELSTDKVFDCSSKCEREKKHDMMLDLSLNDQKTDNLFAGSDQTPTPTRLIRNCEEVGLFEDLQHVNPFEETFRRACEQHNGQTPLRQLDSVEMHADEDSLHTPQVYPQLESIQGCEMLSKPLDSPTSATVTLDVPVVDELLNTAADAYKIGTSRQNSNTSTTSTGGYGKIYKYRTIAEKPATDVVNETRQPYIQLPAATTTIQLIQPQLITLTFAENSNGNKSLVSNLEAKTLSTTAVTNAIPIQTVKPFIMPKLAPAPTTSTTAISTTTTTTMTTRKPTNSTRTTAITTLPPVLCTKNVTNTTSTPAHATTVNNTATISTVSQPTPVQQHEPSSASLTPTSQLPIKERLKAILSMGNKAHTAAAITQTKTSNNNNNSKTTNTVTKRARSTAPPNAVKYDEDSMVRRRAAATRYRVKMRNEHRDLRRRNGELQAENEKLRLRIKQLEQELAKSQQQQQQILQQQQQQILQTTSSNGHLQAVPAQVQIPPSTLHLVMNIPTMVLPAGGQPSLVQPITYRVEKK